MLNELINKKRLAFKDYQKQLIEGDFSAKKSDHLIVDQLFQFRGFPEPFLSEREDILKIWQKNRSELLIRQDLNDFSNFLNTNQIEVLASLLPESVASILSVQSLREDLDVAHTTVGRWLNALNQVYYHFEIKPFSQKIPRSLKKDGKIYLYDWSSVDSEGARFENMVASHLLSLIQYYNDIGSSQLGLYYLRNKEKQEVDFIITNKMKPMFTVEVKLSDLSLDKTFMKFRKYFNCPHFQIVKIPGLNRFFKEENARVLSFENFFNS